jgi:hypothetical protein
MLTARALGVAIALCLVPVTAQADASKAWAAAKANVPGTAALIVGLDIAALTKAPLFKMGFPVLLGQKPEIKATLELLQSTCQIDPLTAIDGFVVATDKDQKQGAAYIQFKGLDEAKIVSCLEAMFRSQGTKDAKITVTRSGAITQLSQGKDNLYVTWIGTDVVAMALEPKDKAQLQAWTGGKKSLATGAVGKLAAKVDTRAAFWVASAMEQEVEKMKMKGGYGALALAKGTLAIDLHMVMPTAVDAKSVADKASAELAAKTNGPGLAPALKPVMEAVKITSAGTEVIVKAAIPEKDLLSIVGALMAGN